MREILAKFLFCDVYDLDNVLLHIPVGVGNAFLCMRNENIGLLFGIGFLAYEIMQRIVEKKDKAYPDIQGWLWGMILTGITIGAINGI